VDKRVVEVLKIPMFEVCMIEMTGVMLHPYDDGARKNYEKAIIGSGLAKLRDADRLPPIPKETIIALLAAERHVDQLRSEIQSDTVKPPKLKPSKGGPIPWGVIAGLELIKSLQVYHKTKGARAHAEARLLIMKALPGPPFYYKGLKHKGRLPKNWKKYAGCAHFWAAYALHGSLPENEMQLQMFLSVAERLRELGVTSQVAFAADPILAAQKIWALHPDFPRIDVYIDLEPQVPIVRFGSNAIASEANLWQFISL
jgi:hypothetical protein